MCCTCRLSADDYFATDIAWAENLGGSGKDGLVVSTSDGCIRIVEDQNLLVPS
jgi:hypothetical protein